MLMNLPEILKSQKKWKARKFRTVKTSKRTELWYRQQLKQFVKTMTDDIERALQQPQGSFFMDDAEGFKAISAKALLAYLEKYEKTDRTSQAENIAQGFVSRGDAQNQAEVSTNLKNQTGVDLAGYLRNSPNIAEKVNALTIDNVQLITNISSQYLDKVKSAVTRAMVSGSLNKDLAAQIKAIGQKTEKRAAFIARDQSSKLNAALTQARHEDLGVKKYMWSTAGDERVRDSHEELDGKVFSYDKPPEVGNPGHDFNCFPGQSELKGLPRPEKLYRRWYSGKLTELVTDNGTVLLATPNHPILTSNGIKSIDSVNVGDYLACEIKQTFDTVKLNGKNLIPTIEQVFNSLLLNGVRTSISSSKSGKFHGDFSDSEIEIISIDSFLIDVLNALFIKKLPELGFTNADMVICKALFSTDSHFDLLKCASGSTGSSFMSRFNLLCSLLVAHLTPLELFCLGLGANIGIIGKQIPANNISRDVEMFSNHIFACAALIHGKDFINWQRDRIMSLVAPNFGHRYTDSFETLSKRLLVTTNNSANFGNAQSLGIEFRRVVNKVVTQASCHIYNLQTVSGYYNINSVFVSNCRCVAIPVFDEAQSKAKAQETLSEPVKENLTLSIDKLVEKSKKIEQTITADINNITIKAGGKLVGLENRLKTAPSIKRKIEAEVADGFSKSLSLNKIGDAIRYTTVFKEGDFVTRYKAMQYLLAIKGYKTIIVKNTWKNDSAYTGVNTFIQNEDGDVFEMQYHTQQSFDLKNGLLHKIYKQFRNPKTPFHEKEKLLLEMRKLSSKIKVPKGIELIEDKK
ncbi:minor capsid protein [Aggregatibacter actinomycetemcomitans]|uniref:Head protein n=2 Tax=Aggregatibacter actinomycetemcomitans TaxID=714 RepID=A0AB74N6D0_AGGAC|nr:phage minor head protein [Aggregatibacter actinomycetemcomitans]NP_852755.1 head protein [Haemophilus phage Aaphi23]MCE3057968.1 minor capsid protein [Aggregatibacter actinomycetemcomitans]TYA21699.1 head protein [Aggregatibacter actinomycetemcomitans]TYA34453.1 head protein [Aggregatibacter actinomycetemcomitans]TYA39505.1 head protein [Aggregatibacter actinomycetemcomitans]TYA45521.1 head protein [Aggregatibacter actinomycetemcomitans]